MELNTATGPEDPVLVIPWCSADGALRWVDLRADPDALYEIAEADRYPALLAALRSLNSARSPVFSAKCDVWPMDVEELIATRDDLLLEEVVAAAGMSGYIDVVFRERAVFSSQHRSAQALHRLERLAADLPHALAKLEGVLRPALLDLHGVREGFALTLYIKAVGTDAAEAEERWSAALRDTVRIFRSRDLLTL